MCVPLEGITTKQKDSTQRAFTGLGELGILDLFSPADGIGIFFSYIYPTSHQFSGAMSC